MTHDGVTDYISIPSGVANGATSLWLSAWCRYDEMTTSDSVLTYRGTHVATIGLDSSNTNILEWSVTTDSASAISATNSFANDSWFKVDAVWQAGGAQSLYIDGALVSEIPTSAATTAITVDDIWRIASDDGTAGEFMQGDTDDVSIRVNVVPTSANVLTTYNNSSSVHP